MGNIQITMDEYLGLKKEIQKSIIHIAKSFVRIGQTLYKIDQKEAYRLDGYKTLSEFALTEYGISASGVSRFLRVYRRYCQDGTIKYEYERYTYAQLVEMLNLPQEDETLIRPETSREDIRELKRFNREGEHDIHALESWKDQAPDDEEELKNILRDMLLILFAQKDREADFNEICERTKAGRRHEKVFAELVNPGGNKTIRNGRAMTFLFESEICIKVWGKDTPIVTTYEKLMECFAELFRETLKADGDWWALQYTPHRTVQPEPQEEIAPAQRDKKQKAEKPEQNSDKPGRSRDKPEREENEIPGQDTILNHPEYLPEKYKTTSAEVNGEPVPAAVEPTKAQQKEECFSLLSTIQGNVTLEKYEEAYLAAGRLVTYLEVMKC